MIIDLARLLHNFADALMDKNIPEEHRKMHRDYCIEGALLCASGYEVDDNKTP